MKINAIAAIPLFEDKELRNGVKSLDNSLFQQSFGNLFERFAGLIFSNDPEPDQIHGTGLHRKRATASPTALAKAVFVLGPGGRSLGIDVFG